MKIIQITDTHFSPSKPHFNGNWAPLLEWLDQQKPDLIIHSGDLTVDGADHDTDIVFSMDLMRQAKAPMLILPGNHDVGHVASAEQPVTAERLARWRGLAGPDRFAEDAAGWRFIGLNSLLFGLEDAEAEAQFEWLQAALASRAGRKIALFAHQPLFVDSADEGDTGYWSIRPAQRQRLFDMINGHDVALYASGHLHWAWQGAHGGMALAWAPSAAFVIGDMVREMPGERLVGAVIHEIDADGIRSEIVAVPGMTAFVIDDVIDEVYPQATAPKVTENAE